MLRPRPAARRDVRVAAEDVLRVVAVLDGHEAPVLLAAEGGLDHIPSGLGYEVDVHTVRIGGHRPVEATSPLDVPLAVGGIGPLREDVVVPLRVAVAERRLILGHPREGASSGSIRLAVRGEATSRA